MSKFQAVYWVIFTFSIAYCCDTYAQATYVLSAESEVKISGTSSISDWTVTGRNPVGKLTFNYASSKHRNQRAPVGTITAAQPPPFH